MVERQLAVDSGLGKQIFVQLFHLFHLQSNPILA